MPTIQDSGAILTSIGQDLADNNAGLISAEDVRHNMEDTVASIPNIVSLSDTENTYYFRNNVLVSGDAGSIDGGAADKRFITEGGIQFPNTPVNYHPALTDNIQIEPYPGSGKLDHNLLTNRDGDSNDCHPQYLLETAGPSGGMRSNLRMRQNGVDPHWIGPSGLDDEGFQFTYDGAVPVINSRARIVFADGSTAQDVNGSGTAKGVAKAWCNFDASGTPAALPVIRSSYNIDSLQRVSKGVIKITFASGVFADNNYVAIGNSNANTGSGNYNAFDINTVGLLVREGDDATSLRSIHYVIRSDDNDLVDAEINDFVAFGLGPDTIADPSPTVS